MDLLNEFFNSKSDANKHLEASQQEELEREFQGWLNEKSKDLEFSARFMIKHLAENYHPHTCCIVDSTRAEIFEAQKVFNTDDYLVD